MSTLLLLRHGQAAFGADDYDRLSDLGQAQARATGRFFRERGLQFDEWLVGPRRRQADTARLLLDSMGLTLAPTKVPALDEMAEGQQLLAAAERHFNVVLQGPGAPSRDIQLRRYDAMMLAWGRGEGPIGERASAADFQAGVAAWLEALVAQPGAGRRVIAVTSAGVIGAAISHVLGLPSSRMVPLVRVLHNCALTEIAFSSDGRKSMLRFNETAHLPPDVGSAI